MDDNQLISRGDRRAAELQPIAPPRILNDVYTPEQTQALFDAIHRGPACKLLVAEFFKSAEEIFAATSGMATEDVSIDAFLDPMFRGDLAQHSACFDPSISSLFYNEKLIDIVQQYWGASIIVPRQLVFNIGAPMKVSDPGHVDASTFRGLSHTNTPFWLLAVMANSMLFRDYKVNVCALVTWFWSASEFGGFTYWPDGAAQPPKRIPAPLWNTGCVAENESMFHRGESIGSSDQWGLKGLTFQSVIEGDPASKDHWLVRDGDHVIARYKTDELRWMFHWTAYAFDDREAFMTFADHKDDLTHERVFEVLLEDLKADGHNVTLPADPLNDPQFKNLLVGHYAIGAPKIYPPEATVASLAA